MNTQLKIRIANEYSRLALLRAEKPRSAYVWEQCEAASVRQQFYLEVKANTAEQGYLRSQ